MCAHTAICVSQPNFYRKIPYSNASCPPYPPLSPPVLQEKEKEKEKDEDFEDEKHSLPAARRERGREKERRTREREGEGEREREREGEERERARLEEVNTQISRENHDTIGMVAIDSFNNIAAVSTY
jgi:isoaspartyl peptidase/L-asparaginase-like protein (Ntn-hydrolase superfamily)